MNAMIDKAGLKVAEALVRFIEEEALPGTGVAAGDFWSRLAALYARFAPRNGALLARRDELQAKLDAWHERHAGQAIDQARYQAFLREIGYLVEAPAPFQIAPERVDDEVARLAGPQLVVPVLNARFVLNAANARWGSLYDALYGTDAIEAAPAKAGYDPARGALVTAWAKAFLDEAAPLANGKWADLKGAPVLAEPSQLIGHAGENILLRHHGLHIEIVIDRNHPIGRDDPAGIADVILEFALTTIVDLEDSIAAVDAEDKVVAYANWLGLMRGDLEDTFEKNGAALTRRLNARSKLYRR